MKQRVRLQVRPCKASRANQRHEPHLYHIRREAVEAYGDEKCVFFAYFWCAGVEPVTVT
jgi:hypothetical protein